MNLNLFKESQSTLFALLALSFVFFLFLVFSPFIPFSPILYVTKSEKAMIYNTAGLHYLNLKDFSKAEENFKRAASYQPSNIEYQENLGVALFAQQDKNNEAKEVFSEILRNNPQNLTSFYYLSNMALNQSDYEEAKNKLQAYLNINPQNPEVLALLGTTYYKLNNKEGAKEQWQKALQINPNFEAAKNNLAILEQEMASAQK